MRRFGEVLTTRGRAFCSAGITLMVCGYVLGFRDLTRVGVLLLGLPLLAGLLARRRPPGLVVTRTSDPVQVSAGEATTVTTTVANGGHRSTPLMLAEEQLDHVLGERPRVLLGSLGAGERRALTYALRPPLRGRHLLGPLTVQLRDPFGLSQRFVEAGEPTEVLVLPRVYPLGGNRPPGTGVGAEGEIPFMVALHGEDDQSIREYRDGDDLRRIHWPATARTGELMVRQEDRPARRRAIVLLDPRVDAHAGVGVGSSFEWAVSAAASMVVHLSGLGYAVHLLTPETVGDGPDALPIDPAQALAVLAVAEPDSGLALARLTRAALGLLSGGGLLVAVLAAHDESALRSVATLRHPGATALGMVLDTGSFAGRPAGGGADAGGRAVAPEAARAVDLLRGAGWRATTVTRDDTVEHAWSQVGSRRDAQVALGASR
jgi:uncharacterized protein (DUF58 family)